MRGPGGYAGWTKKPTVYHNSLAAFVQYLQGLPWKPEDDETTYHVEWSGGTWEQAIELATHGWPEGARLASEKVERIANRIAEYGGASTYPAIEYDVIGAAYDAGAVALGMPEAWGVLAPQEAKRAVRLGVNIVASAGVGPEVLRTRGIAVAALAIALQSRGYPVTIDVTQGGIYVKGHAESVVRIADAATGSQLDVDRIVFALAHPTMLRRLFRAETNGYQRYSGWDDVWGPHSPDSNAPPPGVLDVFIGGAHLSEVARWRDGGESWVLAEYERQTKG